MLGRAALIAIGLLATALAILGAILPGLPTTPFLLVALWAFARSSERLHGWLQRIPLLRSALSEAQRFEQRKAVRLPVKLLAVSVAWGSTIVTALAFGATNPIPALAVAAAAVGATAFMWWIPTDHA